MNTYGHTQQRKDPRSEPFLAGQLVVLSGNVNGHIETVIKSQEGNEAIVVRLEDGQELIIPRDLLARQVDGTWHLPYRLDELKAVQQRSEQGHDQVVPVVQEELVVGKRQVETGRVRITKRVNTHEEVVDEPLYKQEVDVVRVPVNQVVAEPPQPRQEGETLIVPVFEEVLVVEKRLMLKEELHIRQHRVETHHPQKVTLRSETVEVERFNTPDTTAQDKEGQS